jgi:hypothetical protein
MITKEKNESSHFITTQIKISLNLPCLQNWNSKIYHLKPMKNV